MPSFKFSLMNKQKVTLFHTFSCSITRISISISRFSQKILFRGILISRLKEKIVFRGILISRFLIFDRETAKISCRENFMH